MIVTGMESIPSPCCGKKLVIHGTCTRTLKGLPGIYEKLRLRVMECTDCGRTHRELLEGTAPYRRYSVELLCAIFEQAQDVDGSVELADNLTQTDFSTEENTEDGIICEPNVQKRITEWVSWFLAYIQTINECAAYSLHSQSKQTTTLSSYLNQCIRSIVNAGKWKIQHHFVMPGF